jgi:hypothetical protein
MAEPYKSTPASRVFGMGLPRRKVDNPGTIFGIEVDEPRWSLDPRLRRDMAEEQQMAMQEQALADQQAQMDRQRRVMEAEDAAIADIEAGADIGNVFKQRPGLALSRNFNQFANMAQMVQPSKATSTLAPSLAKSLAPQSREKFFNLIQTPQFANDPLGAMTQVQLDEEREKQHGELVKAGIPLAKIDRSKTYSPIEFQELILNAGAKGKDPAMEAMEKQMGMLRDELKFMADSGDFEIPNPSASASDPSIPKFIPRPAYAARQKKLMELSDRYQSYLEGIHSPQQVAAAAAGASPPPQAEPQVGFKDRMKGLAGGAANTKANKLSDSSGQMAIQPLSDEEVTQQFGVIVESGSPDEVASIATSKSPNLGDNIRKKAVEKLQQFLKENPRPDDTLNTFFARKESIQKSIRDANEQLARNPIRREYKAAQDVEMKAIDDAVAKMATDLGLDKQMIVNTLSPQNKNGSYKLPSSIVPDRYRNRSSKFDGKIFIKDLAAAYVADEIRKIGELKPSKATYLSLNGKEPIGMEELYIALPPSYSKFKSSKIGDELVLPETVSDLLVKYIDSRANMSSPEMSLSAAVTSPQNQVAQPAPTLNVKNVRVKPPEQP